MTIPQSIIDRIQKEAEKIYSPSYEPRYFEKQDAYIAGAESEAMRAQELVEVLKMCYKSLCTYGEHPIIDKAVEQALKNYGE